MYITNTAHFQQATHKQTSSSSALLSLRNTHAAISKLPDEILCRVFLFLKLQEEFDPNYAYAGRYSWVPRVTQVCQAWRNMALQHPRLWNTISLPSSFAKELILRSKAAPLHLYCELPDSSDNELEETDHKFWWPAEMALEDINRLHTLELYGSDSDDSLGSLMGIFDIANPPSPAALCAAPFLEVLRIKLHVSPYDQPLSDALCLPLWAWMRNLCSLELSGVFLPLPLTSMPRLSTLTVEDPPNRTVPLSWLLESLRNTPNVETITVTCLTADTERIALVPPEGGETISVSARQSIPLPRLKMLDVESSCLRSLNFLACISIPHSAVVICKYGAIRLYENTDLSVVERAFSKFSQPASESDIIEVSIERFPFYIVEISRKRSLSPGGPSHEIGKAYFDLPFDPEDDERISEALSDTLTNASSLTLRAFYTPSRASALRAMIPHCGKVTRLEIVLSPLLLSSANVSMFYDLCPSPTDASLLSLPLPELRHIIIRDLRMDPLFESIPVSVLRELLQRRKAASEVGVTNSCAHIKKVSILRWGGASLDDVRELETTVEEVEWDEDPRPKEQRPQSALLPPTRLTE